MSIVVDGAEFRTLEQELFVNGAKVYEVWVDGEKVYPDGYNGIMFFIDTSGSMSAGMAIVAINSIMSSSRATFFSAKAYGDYSNIICDWTPDINEVISQVASQSFSGSGDDEYPLAAMKALVNDVWIGRPSHIAVIGDYEFSFSDADNADIDRLYAANGLSWSFTRAG